MPKSVDSTKTIILLCTRRLSRAFRNGQRRKERESYLEMPEVLGTEGIKGHCESRVTGA